MKKTARKGPYKELSWIFIRKEYLYPILSKKFTTGNQFQTFIFLPKQTKFALVGIKGIVQGEGIHKVGVRFPDTNGFLPIFRIWGINKNRVSGLEVDFSLHLPNGPDIIKWYFLGQ